MQCPISILDREACEIVSIVESCEGGMGGGFLPSAFLDETFYYHQVRKIIQTEKYKMEQAKDKR